jgi:hypothetical protein
LRSLSVSPFKRPFKSFYQELLGELQTDEIWWHPKGLVKEDPTKPKSKLQLKVRFQQNVKIFVDQTCPRG